MDAAHAAAFRQSLSLIANQSGWHILNTRKIAVTWDGGGAVGSLRVEPAGGNAPPFVGSHFGSGILTWNMPCLFRTLPCFNLLVRGPANWPKDGVQPLEGIVETDWADATFTMNWQMTRPHFTVNEPKALIVPERRGELEGFRPETGPISHDPALNQAHDRWRNSRIAHNAGLKVTNSNGRRQGWQKHNFRGTSPVNTQGSRASKQAVATRLCGSQAERAAGALIFAFNPAGTWNLAWCFAVPSP